MFKTTPSASTSISGRNFCTKEDNLPNSHSGPMNWRATKALRVPMLTNKKWTRNTDQDNRSVSSGETTTSSASLFSETRRETRCHRIAWKASSKFNKRYLAFCWMGRTTHWSSISQSAILFQSSLKSRSRNHVAHLRDSTLKRNQSPKKSRKCSWKKLGRHSNLSGEE